MHYYRFIFVGLDDILLKCASETKQDTINLLSRQPSLHSILSPSPVHLDQNPYKLAVGSLIQYANPAEYGMIKWIGLLPGRENIYYAGVEMVSFLLQCM